MPLRFRKSFKILPGVKINLSKSGVSTSLGGRGASVNFGKRGVRTTVGLPGTGISYSSINSAPKTSTSQNATPRSSSLNPAQRSANNSGCLNGLIGLIVLPFRIMGDLINSLLNPTTRKSTAILVGVLTGICVLCFGVTSIAGSGGTNGTPTQANDLNSIGTQAMINAWSIYTQTAAAFPQASNTPIPDSYVPPTITLLPTWTATSIMPTETATIVYIPPTAPPASDHPLGTSGLCNDGTYTSAQHKQGACSHHNGVSQWWGP